VSFVVAWQGCPRELSHRLRSWGRWVHDGVDVVVVRACEVGERQRIERAHPGVRVVQSDPGQELRVLRQLGVSAAHGDIVVIFDDTAGWTSSWRDSLPVTVGGAVLPSEGIEWVRYEGASRNVSDARL
jgi:hypothetical protein